MFPYFTILGRQVGTYAIIAVAGIALCMAVAYKQAKKQHIDFDHLLLLMVVALGGLVVGAHLLFGMTHWEDVLALLRNASHLSFGQIFKTLGSLFGGMVFYGGLFGAIAGTALYTRFSKVFTTRYAMDLLAFVVPLFHTFGRIGCFFGGCCYGIESSFGITATHSAASPALLGVSRFPVQLVEAACNLLIFFVLYRLFTKDKAKGHLMVVYFALYAPTRFVLEFFRGDAIRGIYFGLSTSQWISLGLMLFAVVYYAVKKRTVGAKSE